MAIKAIIFDCFGVLVLNVGSTIIQDFPKQEAELNDLFIRADNGFLTKDEYINELCSITGLTIQEFNDKYWGKKVRNEQYFAWAKELRSSGYKVALLSNVYRDGIDHYIDAEERDSSFDAVVLSFEIHTQKPEKEAYLAVSDKLGVEPGECIMIDDTRSYVEGANRVGMHGVLFTSSNETKDAVKNLIEELANA